MLPQQQTLGIVPLSLKSDILVKIKKRANLKVLVEKEFELSIEQAHTLLNKNIKEQQSVVGLILEGSNAITDWLKIIRDIDHDTKSTLFFHGSSNPTNALNETDWFHQNFVLSNGLTSISTTQSTASTTSTTSTASTYSIPVKVSSGGSRKNLLKKHTTTTKTSVSGSGSATSTSNQRKVGLRDTTLAADGSRISSASSSSSSALKKPSSVRSKIPNAASASATAAKSATATTSATKSRLNNAGTATAGATSKSRTKPITTTASTNKRSDVSGRRVAVTSGIPATIAAEKLVTTKAIKGGVSKNTPRTTLAGRTKEITKVEKKPVKGTSEISLIPKKGIPATTSVIVATEKEEEIEEEEKEEIKLLDEEEEAVVYEEEKKEEEIEKEEGQQEDEAIVVIEQEVQEPELVSDHPQQEQQQVEEEIVEHQEKEEEEEEHHINVLTQHPVSHPSTTSSSADEHDAEVAAATSNKNTTSVRTTAYVLQNSGRSSSFSPNSVSSLPRPETPEVDQLRLRFETIIQTANPPEQFMPRRPSSKMSQEYIAARIKDMKPKKPVGTKVTSMVDLFMDENLNKWEF